MHRGTRRSEDLRSTHGTRVRRRAAPCRAEPMSATIGDVHDDTIAIYEAETALVALLYELSFAAEYGYGSTAEAIESVRSASRHAERAAVAAAVGNVVIAAKHEVQSVAADEDAARMRVRAQGYCDDLTSGQHRAKGLVDDALGRARS